MKLLVWILALRFSSFGYAETASSPPSVIVNNYIGREYGPAVSGQVPAVQTKEPETVPAVSTENEDNGIYLGLMCGAAKGKTNNVMALGGLAPTFRFARFLALEGSLAAGLSDAGRWSKDFVEASAHFTAQLTFRSALFDFTPRAGIGLTHFGWSDVKNFSGLTAVLGLQVEMGRFIVSVEASGGSKRSRPAISYNPYSVAYHSYVYRTFARAELDVGLKVGARDRAGLKYSETEYGSQSLSAYAFYYRIGF